MLEILTIIVLSNKNAKNAAARGRKSGGFRGLTLGLWFGGEFIGFFIGMAATDGETLAAYGVALLFAIVGGVASYIIAKTCKPGEYREPQHTPLVGARQLDLPCALTITREKSFVGAIVPYSIYLNGQHMGDLKNGASLQVTAVLVQNVIVAKDAYGTEIKPLFFAVPSGGSAQIVFSTQRFLPEKCGNIALLSDANLSASTQIAPGQQFAANPPQAAYAQSAPPQNYIPQAEALPSMPEDPMRAVWVMGGALLFMLLGALTFLPWFGPSHDVTTELVAFCYPLLISACIYLMLQSDIKYKIFSGAGLLLGAAVYAFSSRYLLIYAATMEMPPIGSLLSDPSFYISIRPTFAIAIVIGVIALIVSAAHRGQLKQKLMLSAWLGATALFLIRLYAARYNFTRPDMSPIRKVGVVVKTTEAAVCLVLLALLVYILCTLSRKELITGTGVKIWFTLCVVFTAGSVVIGLATKTMGIAAAMIALIGTTGYILLLMSKRMGFPILLTAVLINTAAGVAAGLTGHQPSILNALIPLSGFVNPLITWLVIRDNWNGISRTMNRPAASVPYGEKPKVKIAFKIGAIVNILIGGVLFVAALYSMIDIGRFFWQPFLFGNILGGIVIALGIVAAIQSFSGKSKARSTGLLVTQLVIACIGFAVMAAGLISSML